MATGSIVPGSLDVVYQLDVPADSLLQYPFDSLNGNLDGPCKDVRTLLISLTNSTIMLLALLPSGKHSCLATVSFSSLRSLIPDTFQPKDLFGSLLNRLSLSRTSLENVRVKNVRSDNGRGTFIIVGKYEGNVLIWSWDPLSYNEEDEDKYLDFLGSGPAEIDDFMTVEVCQFIGEKRVETLLVGITVHGSIYTASVNGFTWTAVRQCDGLISDCRIVRVDHETLAIIQATGHVFQVFLLTLSGLVELGRSAPFKYPVSKILLTECIDNRLVIAISIANCETEVVLFGWDEGSELCRHSISGFHNIALYRGRKQS